MGTNGWSTEELVDRRSISGHLAGVLAAAAVEQAEKMGFPKVAVCVMGIDRIPLAQLTGGPVILSTVNNARNKAETALNVGRSTREQKLNMERLHMDRDDYGESVKTLFGGGCLLYEDDLKTKVVGSIGVSGAPEEDQDIVCVRHTVGDNSQLFTD